MKRKIALIVIGVAILINISMQITFAYMKSEIKNSERDTSITVNTCTNLSIVDNNSNSIKLENTYPMDDEMGLTTTPYEFEVANTCEGYANFSLYLTSLNDNEINDNNIRFALTDSNNNILKTDLLNFKNVANGSSDFTEDELNELDLGIKGKHKNIYKVYSDEVRSQGTNAYKLYLWIDKDTKNDTMNQTFKLGLSIKKLVVDTQEETFANYLINNKDNTLIYHDGEADYPEEENYNLEALDYSYRYSGASENVNNYVCFGADVCEGEKDTHLYRIIGLFKNKEGKYEAKLIKALEATTTELGEVGAYDNSSYKFAWNNSNGADSLNIWKDSNLNHDNLNGYFLNDYLEEKWQKMIIEHSWQVAGNDKSLVRDDQNAFGTYDSEVGNNKITLDNLGKCAIDSSGTPCTYNDIIHNAKVSLMYVSDYLYGANPKYWSYNGRNSNSDHTSDYAASGADNWLFINSTESILTRLYDKGHLDSILVVSSDGYISDRNVDELERIRPTFYLYYDVLYDGGNGSILNPYRLSYN